MEWSLQFKGRAVHRIDSLRPTVVVFKFKYNSSVDNTTICLNTKIIYFVRATCFYLIRSSSAPPRRQIQDLFTFHCTGGPEDDLIRYKMSSWKNILFLCINKLICYRLTRCIYMSGECKLFHVTEEDIHRRLVLVKLFLFILSIVI